MSEEDFEREMRGAVVTAKEASEQGVQPDEFAMMLAQYHYLYKDDDVLKQVRDDPELSDLLPALSHLIRTTRLTNEKTILEMKVRWRRALRLKLMVLGGKNRVKSMAKFDALLNFGYSVIEDARQGWRGKLVTTRERHYMIEGTERKKRSFLSRLLRR